MADASNKPASVVSSATPLARKRKRKSLLTVSEKKRRQVARCKKNRQQTVNIGATIDSWNELKTQSKLDSNAAVAEYLLDV